MADLKFNETRNLLIDENDAHETASKLFAVLNYLSGAMLSEATNVDSGREGCSLILDMCAQAALYVVGQTHPDTLAAEVVGTSQGRSTS